MPTSSRTLIVTKKNPPPYSRQKTGSLLRFLSNVPINLPRSIFGRPIGPNIDSRDVLHAEPVCAAALLVWMGMNPSKSFSVPYATAHTHTHTHTFTWHYSPNCQYYAQPLQCSAKAARMKSFRRWTGRVYGTVQNLSIYSYQATNRRTSKTSGKQLPTAAGPSVQLQHHLHLVARLTTNRSALRSGATENNRSITSCGGTQRLAQSWVSDPEWNTG